MKRHVSVWLLALVAGATFLAGCAGGGTSDSGEMMPAQDLATIDEKREVIRNASLSLRVDDVRATVEQISDVAAASGGRISGENLNATGDALYADITARVPAERLDAVIDQISGLGTVTSVNVMTEDVTAQGVDLDARIKALTTSITRLQQLLAAATTTKDLVEIEGELTARQADLDSLVAQRAALSEAVAMSTVTVFVTPSSEAAAWTAPGFLSGLESGWNALRSLTAGVITLAGFALPFLAALALIAIPVVIVVVVVRRSKRR